MAQQTRPQRVRTFKVSSATRMELQQTRESSLKWTTSQTQSSTCFQVTKLLLDKHTMIGNQQGIILKKGNVEITSDI